MLLKKMKLGCAQCVLLVKRGEEEIVRQPFSPLPHELNEASVNKVRGSAIYCATTLSRGHEMRHKSCEINAQLLNKWVYINCATSQQTFVNLRASYQPSSRPGRQSQDCE